MHKEKRNITGTFGIISWSTFEVRTLFSFKKFSFYGMLHAYMNSNICIKYFSLSYRMDPLLFRNVLTSASSLTSLVVKNVCSDAMLKLIGNHCPLLQYLDISNSKQVFFKELPISYLDGQISENNFVNNYLRMIFCITGVRWWN